ncbi:cadherin-like beta sandwich domain-containing protein [Paenibacillus sp. strain BS8-2]
MGQKVQRLVHGFHSSTLLARMLVLLIFLSIIPIYPASMADGEAFLVGECAEPDEAWLFCDDFESDRSASYKEPFGVQPDKLFREAGTGLGMASTALASEFSGNTGPPYLSLAFGKSPNPATDKPVGDPNTAYRDVYWRMYVKNSESWTVGDGGTFATFYANGAGNQTMAKAVIKYSYGRPYVDLYPAVLDGSGNPTGSFQSPMFVDSLNQPRVFGLGASEINTWNQIEVRIKQNDPGMSNGIFQMWVNDNLEIDRSNLNWLGSYQDYAFNQIDVNNYLGASSIPLQYRYHDNLVVSTERIGSALDPNVPVGPLPNLIFADNFDAYSDSPSNHGWGEVGGAVVIDPTAGPDGSHAASITYTAPNSVPWFRYPVGTLNLDQVFVDFDFKVDNPSGGSKFLKLFGKQNQSQGYANTTFALNGDPPARLTAISYGNGAGVENDTQTTINYDGVRTDNAVVVEHATEAFIPPSNEWHNFKAFMRYNTDGQRDGEYMVWIDGELRVHATNIKNRNDLNARHFASLDLANANSASLAHPWTLWYDNVQFMRDLPAELKAQMDTGNTNLTAIDVGANSLNPVFDTGTLQYNMELPASVSSVNLSVATENPQATISINGQSVGNGVELEVPVDVNHSNAEIVVTAPNGTSTKTYTITFKRPAVVNECLNPQSGWLHCDTFETNQLNKYYDYFNRWGRFVRSGTGIENSTAMSSYYGFYAGDKLNGEAHPAHGTWLKLAVGKTPDNTVYKPVGDDSIAERDLYWRFYMKSNSIAEGNTTINNGPLARVYGYGPGNVPFMQIELSYPDTTGTLVSKLSTAQFAGGSEPVGAVLTDTLNGTTPVMAANQAGQWRLVEIHAKLNDPGASNGVYELWIDGELESSKTNLDWVGDYTDYGINVVELYNTNNQPGVPGGDYEYRAYDNFIVSSEPIGAPGAISQINANLSNIAKSDGKLSPHFQANVTDYTLTLEHGLTSTDITPFTADEEATVKVNGDVLPAGSDFTLSGTDQALIEVTARNGSTAKTYSVTLAQAAPFKVNECSAANVDWLFCDDYEVDRMDQYFERTSQNQFYRTGDVGLGGSSGMKAEFRQADGAEHDTGAIKIAFGRTPSTYLNPVAAENEDLTEVYFRFYLKHEKDWIGGGGDKLARLSSMQTENWAQSMIAHVWSGNNNGRNLLVAEPARGTDASGTLLSTKWNDWPNLYWFGGQTSQTPIYDENHVGSWYAVETRVKLNDPGQSNGIFEIWIDDELQMSRTDLNLIGSYEIGPGKGYGLNWLALENYWNAGTPQDQERYFDNFVISRSKIGLAVDDAAPETASGNLTIDESSKQAGDAVELTISAVDVEPFTVSDVIIQYDPEKLEFATATSGNTVALASSAIESLLPNYSIISAVKENEGQIRVILTTTGAANAVSGSLPIFKLYGKVKDAAAAGSSTVSLVSFGTSKSGVGNILDVSGAIANFEVLAVDRTTLIALTANALQIYADAVVGNEPGQYPSHAKTALNTAIQAALAVQNDNGSTQTGVSQAILTLEVALTTFSNAVHVANPANFTALQAAISIAEGRYASTIEGNKLGQYSQSSRATFHTAIQAAMTRKNNNTSTQAQVDLAVTTLNQAVTAYSASIITFIAGQTQITINDLSFLAEYFAVKESDEDWNQVAIADLLDHGEITIETLAAVAQMILADWLTE